MLDDLTFAQLRTFACAAKTSSFTLAADQLNITPPSVSEHIKALENRLSCRLFHRRSGATPVLTPAGEEALEKVEVILAASASLIDICRQSAEKVTLAVAVGPYLRETYVRQILPRIYREFPHVQVDFHPIGPRAEMARFIDSGELDLAVFTETAGADNHPFTRSICELRTVAIAPPGTRARLNAQECTLEDFRFIFPGYRESALWARQRLREMKVVPRFPLVFIEFIEGVIEMVEDGQGIGLTMEYAIADSLSAGRLEVLDIPLPAMRRLVARSPHAPKEALAIEEMLCGALMP